MDSETPAVSSPEKDYALNGKILLSAMIVLFGIVILLAVLHLYARWYLHRLRSRQTQRQRRRRRRRRTHIVFFVDNHHPNSAINQGLEKEVLDSLPLFVYSAKTHPEMPECAVCLSEFEENEKGRLLPKCNHSFHIECIDMWFHSHSTCPLCRSSVEPPETAETVINVDDPIRNGNEAESDPGSSSGSWLCTPRQHEESRNTNTTSLSGRRKGLDLVGVRIEVPRTSGFNDELPTSLPPSQGFRSPGTRLRSFKRILCMNKKSPIGTSAVAACGAGTSCGTAGTTELALGESSQESTRVQTPR